MGKETRIGVGVVGVLVVISAVLLYKRVTRDSGLQIELNVDASLNPGDDTNEVPRQPTIERNPGNFRPTRPVSPAPLRPAESAKDPSFLPDKSSGPPEVVRQLTIPDYQSNGGSGLSSPVKSPATSPATNPPVRVSRGGDRTPQ